MSEIILHEKAWVESALSNCYLGPRPVETLGRVARYYYSEGYKKSEIVDLLEDFLIKCDPGVNITKWQNIIDSMARGADKYPLIEIDDVVITESEMAHIKRVNGKLLQRLLFTLICLAKYGNSINPNNRNWVNQPSKTIFSLANISVTTKRQALMINDLWQKGLIAYSHVVDNVNLNVTVIDDESEPAVRVSDFRNIGNQYMMLSGEGYFQCQECGLVVKRTGNNQKRCKACSDDMGRR